MLGAGAGSLGGVGASEKAKAEKRNLRIVADVALKNRRNMTTGANKDDHHLRGVDISRDIRVDGWLELRAVASGEGCPRCDTGVLEVYDIQNNMITGASQLGTVGTDWKFSGLGNFNDDGTTDLLLRNERTGGLQVYDIKDDKIVGTAFLGTIGTDWMYAGVGPIADDTSQNLLLRNTNGDLESYTIKNNAILDAVLSGQTDPAQTMVIGLVQAMSSNLVENGSSGSMTVAQQPEQQQTMLSQPHA